MTKEQAQAKAAQLTLEQRARGDVSIDTFKAKAYQSANWAGWRWAVERTHVLTGIKDIIWA